MQKNARNYFDFSAAKGAASPETILALLGNVLYLWARDLALDNTVVLPKAWRALRESKALLASHEARKGLLRTLLALLEAEADCLTVLLASSEAETGSH